MSVESLALVQFRINSELILKEPFFDMINIPWIGDWPWGRPLLTQNNT